MAGAARRSGRGLDALGDRRGRALLMRAQNAVTRERGVDAIEFPLQCHNLLVKLSKRSRGIDSALDGIEALASLGGGVLRGGESFLKTADFIFELHHGGALLHRVRS